MTKNQMEDWYSDCDFITKCMQFYSFSDFQIGAIFFKSNFDEMEVRTKKLYQWYIYANVHIGMNQKNLIWDYLNGYKSYQDLIFNNIKDEYAFEESEELLQESLDLF